MKQKELYQQMCRLQSRLDRVKSDFERLLGEVAKDMEIIKYKGG